MKLVYAVYAEYLDLKLNINLHSLIVRTLRKRGISSSSWINI